MNRAQQLRIDAGMSVVSLANKAGVAHGTVRRIERGEMVQANKLLAVADVFSVPASSLLLPAVPAPPSPTEAAA